MIVMYYGERKGNEVYRCNGTKSELENLVNEFEESDLYTVMESSEIEKAYSTYTIYFKLRKKKLQKIKGDKNE
jgi:hypothetical protein